MYIDCDFGTTKKTINGQEYPQYWILERIRTDIYRALQDLMYCITQANIKRSAKIHGTQIYEVIIKRVQRGFQK